MATKVAEFAEVLNKFELWDIDTSIIYNESEQVLGDMKKDKGALTKETIFESVKSSAARVRSIESYFLQSPDPDTPLEETVGAIAELHKQGLFKNFGLSNFDAAETRQVYDMCKKNGWVLPTIHSPQYNAVSRLHEDDLFPTLRELGMSVWIYRPLAAGFLAKPYQSFNLPGSEGYGPGRFPKENWWGSMYNGIFNKPGMLEGHKHWNHVAEDEGIPGAELAYRWLKHHSALKPGDKIILGANSADQLRRSLEDVGKGPLKDSSVRKIDEIRKIVRDDAPDNKPQYMSFD